MGVMDAPRLTGPRLDYIPDYALRSVRIYNGSNRSSVDDHTSGKHMRLAWWLPVANGDVPLTSKHVKALAKAARPVGVHAITAVCAHADTRTTLDVIAWLHSLTQPSNSWMATRAAIEALRLLAARPDLRDDALRALAAAGVASEIADRDDAPIDVSGPVLARRAVDRLWPGTPLNSASIITWNFTGHLSRYSDRLTIRVDTPEPVTDRASLVAITRDATQAPRRRANALLRLKRAVGLIRDVHTDADCEVRVACGYHPETPVEVLARLADDPDPMVRAAATARLITAVAS
jgi:hypothetical protein